VGHTYQVRYLYKYGKITSLRMEVLLDQLMEEQQIIRETLDIQSVSKMQKYFIIAKKTKH